MRFESPEWLALIPALALLGWYARHLHFERPLRLLCLLLLVLALMDPQWQVLKRGVDLIVLADRSESAEERIAPLLPEWEGILAEGRSGEDTLRVIDFAEEALDRTTGEAAYAGGRAATRTDLALRYALAQRDPERTSRVLVFTDGYSTAPLGALAEAFNEAEVAVHYRLLNEDAAGDVRVAQFNLPDRTQLGAPFLIEFKVEGVPKEAASYRVYRNDLLIGEGAVAIEGGQAWIRLRDRLVNAGAFEYAVRIVAPGDPKEGNNFAKRWIAVDGGPRVLLVSAYVDDPLKPILAAQGFTVDLVTDYGALGAGRLSGVKAALINNVPAHALPSEFLKELRTYVTVQGGGFAMFGGKFSFGSGGFYQSALDEILPVSMELREDQMRLATAMAIVMDRSGSMSAMVAGGQTKMDLANAGAAGTIDLLGPTDSITVFAVDSLAHEVVEMTVIGGRAELLRNQILHIESQGGGIFVYTGLKAAWEQLRNVSVGQKHIILFADAADAEEPGDYRALLEKIRASGGTVSVIGLGTETDPDAEFLKDIALRGGGRIFFNADPMDLPRVFAQETVAVARASFIEEPVALVPGDGWLRIAARPMRWLEQVDGYNLSYLKQGATAIATSGDDFAAPLAAFQRFGAGRSVAVTFPVAGDFSERTRQWDLLPDMVQTLVRWLAGEAVPEGIGLKVRVEGSQLRLSLLHDATHDALVARHPPTVFVVDDASESATELTWRRIQPGEFSAETDLEFGRAYKGAVQMGPYTLPFGPVMATGSIEWQPDPERLGELRALAASTGGGALTHLGDIWKSAESERYVSFRLWVLVLLLLVGLGEFYRTRAG